MNTPKKAFEIIYQENYPKVLRVCKGYHNGDEMIAKDVTQEVFIKVWQKLDTFRDKANISTWIYRIAVNTCLMNLRKVRKKTTAIDRHLVHLEDALNTESEEKEKQFHLLYNCIDNLNTDNKSIILLELEGLPQQDIAEIMGLSHEAIRTRVHRIKNQLTKCVKK